MIPALLHAFSKPTSENFHTLVRSEGVRVWDDKGKEYVDGLGGLWYCQVGHGRPELIDAITEQLQKMSSYHTFAPMGSDVSEAAAERIRSVSPFPDGRVFLCCSGSESIDTAIKLLRKIPILRKQSERQIILRRGRGYHGVNIGGTTMQGIQANREGWGELFPNVIEIDPTNIESAASIFAEYGEQIAGVVTEPLQGAGGVFPPPSGYLEGLRRLCDDNGALLVFDEVITGFGRTGNWFATDTYGVKPDIITFAKGVTSGYQPLGGVLISRTVCDVLESDPDFTFMHGYTYSGHPAASAAAIANINIIENEGLVQRAEVIGDRLSGGLKALEKDGIFSEVRGEGAIWAAQVTDASTEQGLVIRDKMTEMGVICRAINGALAFCPPLVIEENDIDLIVDTAAKAVEEVTAK
ncbi:MAG: aspartate aminotransferase family protein [Actinobacteria bacterium]|nr:aspartate aminotransferase family protein [Actinomycetota bacterium]|tara:strand:- start:6681 stop:7910 length:1230 start_codon:yes stop_codon:yes gene_type:complete